MPRTGPRYLEIFCRLFNCSWVFGVFAMRVRKWWPIRCRIKTSCQLVICAATETRTFVLRPLNDPKLHTQQGALDRHKTSMAGNTKIKGRSKDFLAKRKYEGSKSHNLPTLMMYLCMYKLIMLMHDSFGDRLLTLVVKKSRLNPI